MPGTGTGTAAITSSPPFPDEGGPCCLDLTRLVRRVGLGPPTGVDRVEAAYLRRLLAMPGPAFGLVRTAPGFAVLDRAGLETFARWAAADRVPDVPDRLRLLRLRQTARTRRAEAAVSSIAIARAHRLGLARILARHLPPGTAYFNVGHSNLTERVLAAWHALPGARAAVLIHDTIPLDLPESQRPGQSRTFRRRLRAVARHADLVVHVSDATRRAAEAHMVRLTRTGRVPPGIVAHPGIVPARPDPAAIPPGVEPAPPYFVALGTIEPRKNHALLLDVWDLIAAEGRMHAPRLLILGRRGWKNEAVFARLDRRPLAGGHVTEAAGLSDGAVAALLQRSAGLLMPSLAEGFGMPVVEAAAMGVPVIATDLPVYRETVGDFPVYLAPDDPYQWKAATERLAAAFAAHESRDTGRAPEPPSWDEHFNIVFTALCDPATGRAG